MKNYTLQMPDELLYQMKQKAATLNITPDQFLLTLISDTLQQSNAVVFQKPAKWGSFLETAAHLEVAGPPDWSENIDDYLYGDKRDK